MGMDLQEYYISTEWDVMTAPAVRNEKYYPCCEEPYPVKTIKTALVYYGGPH